ncbi:sigma-70 family RNA polymerase sigma factor [Kutzneria sp. CA-103260]|uniref:sigma-70 family RNA polymerase sigma factor n=1 Tax=Kutzneria sp. CA-103260 TaxID=2802641 RepID=UPI001BA86229|nr:sigma-70 family RNA polymerase sigma factor [Kutzneria sp. CA-103260]QUQ68301.1 ECF family RNA polymerase sigma factor [Kutzneria sp. CA-103260]
MDTTKAETGSTDDLEQAVAVFTSVRPQLFGIAYRMLSSVTEAEDLVQDVWLRWQTYDRSSVDNPPAFLTATTTRLAINLLQSARVRRETYIGPWLPEPVDTSTDPYLGAERGEALEYAALLLMEKLTPNERAAYVLREAFDYSYGEIADVLTSTEPAVRQLVSRARKHMTSERKTPVTAARQKELLTSFLTAAKTGDMAVLEKLFAGDVANVSDGNGRHRVARKVIVGALPVAKFLHAMVWFWDGVELDWVTTNGLATVVIRQGGLTFGMLTISASTDGIDQVLWMLNTEKITDRSLPARLAAETRFGDVTKPGSTRS